MIEDEFLETEIDKLKKEYAEKYPLSPRYGEMSFAASFEESIVMNLGDCMDVTFTHQITGREFHGQYYIHQKTMNPASVILKLKL